MNLGTAQVPGRLTHHILALALICAVLTGCSRTPAEQSAMFLKSGKSYFRKHDYASALLQFKNAARLAPKDPEPWFYLGQAYLGVRDARQAIISLVRATQINPKYADAQI